MSGLQQDSNFESGDTEVGISDCFYYLWFYQPLIILKPVYLALCII